MLKKVTWVLILAAATTTPAQAFESATVFATNGGIRCSTTLVKIALSSGAACHLLTNAHCLGGDTATLLHYPANLEGTEVQNAGSEASEATAQFPVAARTVPAKTIRKSRYLDLVDLEMPADLGKFCQEKLSVAVPGTYNPPPNYATTFQATGYVNGQPMRRYSRNLPWDGGYGPSTRQDYVFSLTPHLTLLRMGEIQVTRGMSGGPVTSNVAGFTGIIARYLPFQNAAYAIPAPLIAYFLELTDVKLADIEKRMVQSAMPKGSQDLTESQANNGLTFSGDNILDPSGDNSHADGGDNSHADGGSNSHADGGSNSHADGNDLHGMPTPGTSPLRVFREPLEGVVFAKNPSRVLLAVNDHQVDGYDDALMLEQLYDGKVKRYITRPANGYPDAGFRKQIFSRLDGYYRNDISDDAGTRQILWAQDSSTPEGYVALANANPIMDVDIDSVKSTIHLWIYEHPLSDARYGGIGGMAQIPKMRLDFKFYLNADGTHATVETSAGAGQSLKLDCDNRNFLKLICISDRFEMSFSRRSLHSRELDVRVTLPLQVPGKNVVQVANGRFYATTAVEEFRKQEDLE